MKENLLEFYVNKFNHVNNSDEPDLNFVPAIIRRRLSVLDKVTVLALNNTYSEDIRNIVFSSQYGEVERLLKIIDQYTENKEISPNVFSGSVHNYPVAFFLLNKQKPIPYTAIASCESSISFGLLSAVISNYSDILFCYSDINNDNAVSMAINLTKTPSEQFPKFIIKPENNNNSDDKFDNYIKLFEGDINLIKTPTYTIERVL